MITPMLLIWSDQLLRRHIEQVISLYK